MENTAQGEYTLFHLSSFTEIWPALNSSNDGGRVVSNVSRHRKERRSSPYTVDPPQRKDLTEHLDVEESK